MYKKVCPICGKEREVKQPGGSDVCRSCAKKKTIEDGKVNYHERICEFCGRAFIPNSGKQIYCKGPHYRICPICGKKYREDNADNLKRPPVACSYECRTILTKKTSLEKYGTTAPGNNPEARAKSRSTMAERYGAEYTMKSSALRDKVQKTMMDRYGQSNPMKIKQFKIQAKQTNLKRYGDTLPFNYPESYDKQHNTMLQRYGVPYGVMTDACMKSNPSKISSYNRRFGDRLSERNIEYSFEFPLGGKQYDIYIPSCNTLVEINPTFTHSVCNTIDDRFSIDKDYHLQKTTIAENAGYRLIHIFDWDDIDMVIDMLAPRKSLYARNMRVYKLNNRSASNFLNDFHIQGSCRGQLLCLGLVQDDTLYQVMTFGRSRYDKHYDVELLRFCNRKGYSVVGGASRLFRYAMDKFELYSIVSYCDRAKFTGGVYEKIGMKKIRTTPPQEVWSREGKKITANLLRSKGYDALFGTNYGKGTSNDKLMIEHGWLPVYDCGQIVFATN